MARVGQALRGELAVGALLLLGLRLERLFGSIEREIRAFIGRYEKVGGEIDKVVLQLEAAKDGLLRDLVMLDRLFDKNLEVIAHLPGCGFGTRWRAESH